MFFVVRTITNTSSAINVEYEKKHLWKKKEENELFNDTAIAEIQNELFSLI